MSALTDRIAADHQRVFNARDGLGPHCTCGWVNRDFNGSQKHVAHIAEIVEAAVREQVADAISATVITRDDQRRILNSGYGTEWVNGYIRGVTDAARIARGGAE